MNTEIMNAIFKNNKQENGLRREKDSSHPVFPI